MRLKKDEDHEMIYNEIPEVLEIGNLIDPDTNQEHGYFISTYDISILHKNENDITSSVVARSSTDLT